MSARRNVPANTNAPMRIRTMFVGVDAALSPYDARPFSRSPSANPQLPHGRTEASAPTGRFSFSPMVRAILRLHTAGESAASTLTEILRCRRLLRGFGGAPCAGGASPSPTLRRNVVTAQNVPPFSSSGASRHLPLKGKALGCGGLSVAFPLYVWYCNSIHSPADHNCFHGSELRRILC